jgi:hypothetical protein
MEYYLNLYYALSFFFFFFFEKKINQRLPVVLHQVELLPTTAVLGFVHAHSFSEVISDASVFGML